MNHSFDVLVLPTVEPAEEPAGEPAEAELQAAAGDDQPQQEKRPRKRSLQPAADEE